MNSSLPLSERFLARGPQRRRPDAPGERLMCGRPRYGVASANWRREVLGECVEVSLAHTGVKKVSRG